MNKKVLICGGAGFLGTAWANRISYDFETHVTYHQNDLSYFFVNKHQVNLCDNSQIVQLFGEIRPDIVINTVGLTNVEACDEKPDDAYKMNVVIAADLARAAHQCGAKFLHISSDHLFGSQTEAISEEERSTPKNRYAETKLRAEESVLSNHPSALVIRTNFYGNSDAKKGSYSDWIIRNVQEGKELSLHDDIRFSPVWVNDLVDYCHKLLEVNATGIVNVASADNISKYDFAIQLLKTLELPTSLVRRVNLTTSPKKIERPKMMVLDNSKLIRLLGSAPRSCKDGFIALKNERLSKRIINYGRHYVDAEDISAVVEVLKTGYLTQGPKVEELEQRIAAYVGAKYCVAVSNWTAGIHLAFLAAGLNSQNCLITTPMTFCASSNGALYCGSTPLFADIDPESLNISPDKIEDILKTRKDVKAIMPVHFGGHAADMEKIHQIAQKYGVMVIEDAAHALGARYKDGSMVGNCKYADMVGFSFHPVKNIATGEGGAITTNSLELYRKLLKIRSHGINKTEGTMYEEEAFTNGKPNQWYHEMQDLGYNQRITDLQCALGLSQMNKLESFMARRRKIANRYDIEFSQLKNAKIVHKGVREFSGNHLYILRIDFDKLGKARNQVIDELKNENVQGHVHYIPVPMHPYYRKNVKTAPEAYQEALVYYKEALTIPLFPAMKDAEVDQVINVVKRIIG